MNNHPNLQPKPPNSRLRIAKAAERIVDLLEGQQNTNDIKKTLARIERKLDEVLDVPAGGMTPAEVATLNTRLRATLASLNEIH